MKSSRKKMCRKRSVFITLVLVLSLLMSGCINMPDSDDSNNPDKDPSVEEDAGNTGGTEDGDKDPENQGGTGEGSNEESNDGANEGSDTGNTEGNNPEVDPPMDIQGKLQFTQYGRYSGLYVEDGSDEYVENVAAIQVTNISEEYLEYAMVTFDVNGEVAAFRVTGLPAGKTVWVLEQNRMQVEQEVVFTHVDDMASFLTDNSADTEDIEVNLEEGYLTVDNNTGKKLEEVYVYYKQVHTDGNYLGGITYRVPVGAVEKDESVHAVAAHSLSDTCQVVRIDWRVE